jgi:hypothetical protein
LVSVDDANEIRPVLVLSPAVAVIV